MAKQFTKGVSEEVETAEENVRDEEFSAEETKTQLRMNEEDYIHALLEAAGFVNDENEFQTIEIARNGKVLFSFRIRPLGSEEYEECRKKHTKYVRNKQLGMKIPEDTNRVKYQSALIYRATVDDDRAKMWDNKKLWDALIAKGAQIMNGLDVIEFTLKAGEKDRILECIDRLSGYEDNNLEEVAKN